MGKSKTQRSHKFFWSQLLKVISYYLIRTSVEMADEFLAHFEGALFYSIKVGRPPFGFL
jgi:hypothetical protein